MAGQGSAGNVLAALCSLFIPAEHALNALKAGKHVFLDNPLARTLEEGQTILNAASTAKGKFMVGLVVRFSHEYASTKRLLDDGAIGSVGSCARRGAPGSPLAPVIGMPTPSKAAA